MCVGRCSKFSSIYIFKRIAPCVRVMLIYVCTKEYARSSMALGSRLCNFFDIIPRHAIWSTPCAIRGLSCCRCRRKKKKKNLAKPSVFSIAHWRIWRTVTIASDTIACNQVFGSRYYIYDKALRRIRQRDSPRPLACDLSGASNKIETCLLRKQWKKKTLRKSMHRKKEICCSYF